MGLHFPPGKLVVVSVALLLLYSSKFTHPVQKRTGCWSSVEYLRLYLVSVLIINPCANWPMRAYSLTKLITEDLESV